MKKDLIEMISNARFCIFLLILVAACFFLTSKYLIAYHNENGFWPPDLVPHPDNPIVGPQDPQGPILCLKKY